MITGYIVSGLQRQPLFSEGLQDLGITKCVIETGMDEVDSADIELPGTNLAARSLLQRNVIVEIRHNNEVVFLGDVATATQTESGTVRLELDGALGFLRAVCKPPFQVSGMTAADFLTAILNQYNAGVTAERIVHLGTVNVPGTLEMDHRAEYTSMLDLFREVVEQLGGYYFVDYSSGRPTVHYVTAPERGATQLELGRNVLTVENQLDFSRYASRVYATGCYYVTTTVDGKEERAQHMLDAGYVRDADAETAFGRLDLSYRSGTDMGGDKDAGIPDKTEAEARQIIRAEALKLLQERKNPLQSLTMTAAELADLGENYQKFRVGTSTRTRCTPLRIDAQMMVRKVRRDYLAAANTVVTFGQAPVTLIGLL